MINRKKFVVSTLSSLHILLIVIHTFAGRYKFMKVLSYCSAWTAGILPKSTLSSEVHMLWVCSICVSDVRRWIVVCWLSYRRMCWSMRCRGCRLLAMTTRSLYQTASHTSTVLLWTKTSFRISRTSRHIATPSSAQKVSAVISRSWIVHFMVTVSGGMTPGGAVISAASAAPTSGAEEHLYTLDLVIEPTVTNHLSTMLF